MLTYEQIQECSERNKEALYAFYTKKLCGDCHIKASYLIYSVKDRIVFNICEGCSRHYPEYINGHKLNEQEIFVLQTLLN